MDHSALNDGLTLLALSLLVVWTLKRLKLPPILGYLFVGVLVGPFALAWLPEGDSIQMLAEIGVEDIDALYGDIPQELRFSGQMNLPEPLISEYALKRHVDGILAKNKTCQENINFLGGGCWQHYVPAIFD